MSCLPNCRPVPIFAFALALCLAGCGKAKPDDQPFGVARGQPLSALKEVRPLNEPPQINYAFTPAEKDPAFDDYAVLASPTVGVCRVRAKASHMSESDVAALRDRLRREYGEAGFNAEAHSYYWPNNYGDTVAGTIATIVLSDLGSQVSLTYTFTNIDACNHELAVQTGEGD